MKFFEFFFNFFKKNSSLYQQINNVLSSENLNWGLFEVKETSKGQMWKKKANYPNNKNKKKKIEFFLAKIKYKKSPNDKNSIFFLKITSKVPF